MSSRTVFLPQELRRLKRSPYHCRELWYNITASLALEGLMDRLFGRSCLESGWRERVSFDFPKARYSVQEQCIWVTNRRLMYKMEMRHARPDSAFCPSHQHAEISVHDYYNAPIFGVIICQAYKTGYCTRSSKCNLYFHFLLNH